MNLRPSGYEPTSLVPPCTRWCRSPLCHKGFEHFAVPDGTVPVRPVQPDLAEIVADAAMQDDRLASGSTDRSTAHNASAHARGRQADDARGDSLGQRRSDRHTREVLFDLVDRKRVDLQMIGDVPQEGEPSLSVLVPLVFLKNWRNKRQPSFSNRVQVRLITARRRTRHRSETFPTAGEIPVSLTLSGHGPGVDHLAGLCQCPDHPSRKELVLLAGCGADRCLQPIDGRLIEFPRWRIVDK